jgi:hypothetical protein
MTADDCLHPPRRIDLFGFPAPPPITIPFIDIA